MRLRWQCFLWIIVCVQVWSIGFASAATRSRVYKVIIQGNAIVEAAAVRAVLSVKKGHYYSLKKVKKDVQNIFMTGWFYDVEVRKRYRKKNSIILTYVVKEKPIVEKIIYKGQKNFSTKKLDEIFNFSSYEFLNHKRIRKAIKDLYLEYEKKGYYLAKIYHSIQKTKHPGKVNLVINIKENKKVTINEIHFIGNRFISAREIKQFMGTKEAGLLSFLSSSGSYSQEILEKDLNNIRYIYLDRGYWKAHVDRPDIVISPDRRHIAITIRIHEGSQYKAGTIHFAGDLIFSKSELKEDLETSESDVFSYGKLQRDIQRIQRKYGDKGYAFVNVMPKFFIPPGEDRTVHVLFEIQKGKEVKIRKIAIFGNHYTRDKVIRREVRIFEGELYNETNKELSVANIRRLGFFDEVQMLPKTIKSRDDLADMEITIKERESTGSLDFGAAYGGQYYGLSFTGKLQKFNVFGTGRNIGMDMNLNFVRQLVNLNFSNPYFLDSRWYLGGDFYLDMWNDSKRTKNIFQGCDQYEEAKLKATSAGKVASTKDHLLRLQTKCWQNLPGNLQRGFSEQKISGGITFGRSVTDTLKLLLYYRLEKMTLTNSIDEELFPVKQVSGVRNPTEAIIEYDGRDDRLFPTGGFYSRGSLMHDGLFGKFNYLTVAANVRAYKKLIWNVVFRTNVQYSRHIGLGGGGLDVPFDRLFRLGGINSLRGFEFFSIGPRRHSKILFQKATQYGHPNPNAIADRVYGGHQQLYVNWELQVPIFPSARAYGVLFVDMGAAYDEMFSMEWRSNWGAGLRVFTPLGPVRLEMGFPFFPQLDRGERAQFNFTMGFPF